MHINQWNWHRDVAWSRIRNTRRQTQRKKIWSCLLSVTPAQPPFSWQTGQHKTYVSNLNINLKHEIWNLSHGNTHHFYEKEKKQKWSRNKQATRAQPTFLERDSNSKQMLAISTSTLNLTYETFSMGHDHIFFENRRKNMKQWQRCDPNTAHGCSWKTERHGSDISYFKQKVD